MITTCCYSFIDKILNIPDPKDRELSSALIHSLLLNEPIEIILVHNAKNMIMLKNCTASYLKISRQ